MSCGGVAAVASFLRWCAETLAKQLYQSLKRTWTHECRSSGRDTRPACPFFRERTSGPLVPTLRGKVHNPFGVGISHLSPRRARVGTAPRPLQGGLRKAVVVRRFGAGDGAATFHCSVGVPADESMGSRHTVLRLQKNLTRSSPRVPSPRRWRLGQRSGLHRPRD